MKKIDWLILPSLFLSLFLLQGCKNPSSDRQTPLSSYVDPSAPTVSTLAPTDGDGSTDTTTTIEITFDEPMDISSITGITSGTNCSGSVQLSTDDFTTCLSFSSNIESSNDSQTFAFTPSPSINGLTDYKIKLTSAAESEGGAPLAEQVTSFTTKSLSSRTFPEDEGNKTSWSRVKIIFDTTMDATTIVANTSDTNCSTGSILISEASSDFSTCVRFSSDPTADVGNTTFALKPLSDLSVDTAYKGKITTAVTGSEGQTNLADYTWSFTTASREWIPDTSADDDPSNYPQSYTASGDTLIDNVTTFTWQKCSVGFSGSNCEATTDAKTWANSASFCSDATTDSKTDWRFPKANELAMIVDWGTSDPSINSSFLNTQSACYWSSSSSPNDSSEDSSERLSVNFKFSNIFNTSTSCYSRCVRRDEATSNPSFSDPIDETIWDNKTDLMWQKCAKGQSGTNCSGGAVETVTWTAASPYCEDSVGSSGTLAGHSNWRLPTVNELESLVDLLQSSSPLLDSKFEGAAIGIPYWSSTKYAASPTKRAWSIDFNTGIVDSKEMIKSQYVRCVR